MGAQVSTHSPVTQQALHKAGVATYSSSVRERNCGSAKARIATAPAVIWAFMNLEGHPGKDSGKRDEERGRQDRQGLRERRGERWRERWRERMRPQAMLGHSRLNTVTGHPDHLLPHA